MDNILIFYHNEFQKLEQRFSLLKYIKNNYEKIILLNYDNIKDINKLIHEKNITLIIYFFININNYTKLNIKNKVKEYFYILDNHHFYNQNINNIILPYQNNLLKNTYLTKNILNFRSRYIDKTIYKDHKLEKKYDILIYGTRNFPYNILNNKNLQVIINYKKDYKKKFSKECPNIINFYELRSKIENIIMDNQEKYKIYHIPNTIQNGNVSYPITGIELSKLINQSYMTVCCSSVCDLLFYKHLEIPASNSVILGDYPSDYEDTFKNNIVKIDRYMSEEEIINKIDEALSDKKSLLEKSQKLHDIIHKEHCLENSIEDFKNIIDKIENTK